MSSETPPTERTPILEARENVTTTEYGVAIIRHARGRRTRPRRCNCCCICLVIFCVIAALLTLLLPLILVTNLFCPLVNPLCWKSSPQRVDLSNETYAVGFDLTAGYGTAAISFKNGTNVGVGMVGGDESYRKVMQKMVHDVARIPTPPYYSRGMASDAPRQWLRFLRKKIGLPASKDVGALAKVLQGLKDPVNNMLGDISPFQYATITVPYFPFLYNQDLLDAAEFSGFQYTISRKPLADQAQYPVYEMNTAHAGMGLGLCQDYLNKTKCNEELAELCDGQSDNVFVVSFTQDALMLHVSPFCSSQYFYAADGAIYFYLGLKSKAEYSCGGSPYWAHVKSAIGRQLESHSYFDEELRLSKVVVHGESADNEEFQAILREQIASHQKSGQLPPVYVVNPVYAGAIGAAELVKRCMLTGGDCIPDLHPRQQGW